MGDMGEIFNDMKELKKERRASNTEKSTQLLIDAGIEFESKNGGAHLVVNQAQGLKADFWPSTGLWQIRGSKKQSRGVFNLIKFAKGGSV